MTKSVVTAPLITAVSRVTQMCFCQVQPAAESDDSNKELVTLRGNALDAFTSQPVTNSFGLIERFITASVEELGLKRSDVQQITVSPNSSIQVTVIAK